MSVYGTKHNVAKLFAGIKFHLMPAKSVSVKVKNLHSQFLGVMTSSFISGLFYARDVNAVLVIKDVW